MLRNSGEANMGAPQNRPPLLRLDDCGCGDGCDGIGRNQRSIALAAAALTPIEAPAGVA